MTINYTELLQTAAADLPESKTLPEGTWLLNLRGAKAVDMSDNEKLDAIMVVKFFYSAAEPTDEVDEEELAELGEDYNFADSDVAPYTVFVERPADIQKRVFPHIRKHGIEVVPTDNLETILKGCRKANAQVFAWLSQNSYTTKDGETVEETAPSNFLSVEDANS